MIEKERERCSCSSLIFDTELWEVVCGDLNRRTQSPSNEFYSRLMLKREDMIFLSVRLSLKAYLSDRESVFLLSGAKVK
jgi:hypothetical protein